jgi:flavin reductase (DIM6/NTAB) family NADH-FMN oxidoreductase RutF
MRGHRGRRTRTDRPGEEKGEMMEKVKLGAQSLLFPMPAVLVGTRVSENVNFMTAAWCGIAASAPPALTVAIRRERHTFTGIQENRVFSINVPPVRLAEKVDYCGIYSGRKDNKCDLFTIFYGELDGAPLIRECPVNLECRVIEILDLQSHQLVVGEIRETHVDADSVTDGKPDAVKIDPLIYATGTQHYHRLGEIVGKAFSIGAKR